MIPLSDSEATRRLTLGNTIIIAANLAVFVLEVRLGAGAGPELARFALIPAHVSRTHPMGREASVLATLISSMFLHASVLHVAGNMLYLFIFGPAVEERLGHLRFLAFYLIGGIVAGLATIAMAPESQVAVIGASGAIAGVLGAYLVLFPGARITTILPIFVFLQFVRIPAIFYLLLWFATQLYAGLASGATGPLVVGVAWWAHVGGFLFGVATGPLLARQRPPARRQR
jgi:membrane associated rhomboid family serine protease